MGVGGASGGGGGGGGYLGYVGADPVSGQLVRSSELVKATPAEVAEYLKRYNELDEEDKDKDGTAAGRTGENDAAASSGAGVNGRGTNDAVHGADGRDKSSEGRARDAAPVDSTGTGPRRQGGVPQGG